MTTPIQYIHHVGSPINDVYSQYSKTQIATKHKIQRPTYVANARSKALRMLNKIPLSISQIKLITVKYLHPYYRKREPMRTSEVMAVGNAKDADVTTTAHVNPREIRMRHLLHLLKISYVFTSQDEHYASLITYLTKTSRLPGRSLSVNDIANLQIIFVSASDWRKFFCCCRQLLHHVLLYDTQRASRAGLPACPP